VKFLLDENFPLPLYHRLREAGFDVEHVIVLGQRGQSDSALIERLAAEELVFLTHDTEFEALVPAGFKSQVIISRIPQQVATRERVEIWFRALEMFSRKPPAERLFDLMPDGTIVPWQIIDDGGPTPKK
jgi:predicted nuclease of predicted toxin-antitoxin system